MKIPSYIVGSTVKEGWRTHFPLSDIVIGVARIKWILVYSLRYPLFRNCVYLLPGGQHDNMHHCLVSAVDFYNQINMLYGTITEFCTEASCPVMSAGESTQ